MLILLLLYQGASERLCVSEKARINKNKNHILKEIYKKMASLLLSNEEVDALSWVELKRKCQESGIPAVGVGRTKDVLATDLKNDDSCYCCSYYYYF